MALIRLQNKVPNEYVDRSRDFQLLCRLYDTILNGVKYDIDGIERVVNTHECKSNILQLLQTKLGFFTQKEYTDTTLRMILECFPFLVKGKGTIQAIEQTVYMYLKIVGIDTDIKVDIINNKPTKSQKMEYGSKITDHCVVIGIESTAQDITILKDVLRYIIPFGYNLFFYFFAGSEQRSVFTDTNKAKLILISNDINSAIMGSTPVTDKTYTRGENNDRRQEHLYSEYWENGRYKSDMMKSMISTINMIETGSDIIDPVTKERKNWVTDKQSILNEEEPIEE